MMEEREERNAWTLEHHVVGVYIDWRVVLVMHGGVVSLYFI
jgi:hypothetical protein